MSENKKHHGSFTEKKYANKKLSIWTSIITFILGIFLVLYLVLIEHQVPHKDWAIGLLIILLGLNSVSIGSDILAFLKVINHVNDKDDSTDRTTNDNK